MNKNQIMLIDIMIPIKQMNEYHLNTTASILL